MLWTDITLNHIITVKNKKPHGKKSVAIIAVRLYYDQRGEVTKLYLPKNSSSK